MRVVADRDVIFKALSTAAGVVPQRSAKPILQNILFDARADDKVELLATDLEVGVRVIFSASKTKAGKAVLNSARLLGILREAPSGDVELDCTGDRATLKAGGKFELLGSPAEEFPAVPSFDDATISLPGGDLASALSRVSFAVSREQTRYAINGVSMRVKGKEIEFAATDGRRLAVSTVKLGGKKKAKDASVIVPSKLVGELLKLAARKDGDEEDGGGSEIDLALESNEILARCGDVTLAGRLVEGSFPRYKEVVPQGGDKKVEVEVPGLLRALRQATVMTTDDSRSVRFILQGGDVSIASKTPEVGSAEIPLDAKYKGDDLEVAFNPGFIADGLKAMGQPAVILELDAPDKPLLMREGKEFTYVVMPVKV